MIYGANIYAAQEYQGINGGFTSTIITTVKQYYTGFFHTTKALLRRGLGF